MKNEFENTVKLYHFTSFDTAIKIISYNKLRFGRLSNMNDIHENNKLVYATKPELIEYEIARYRQISFTTDSDTFNRPGFDLHQMWGQYADKGNGICLVFDKDRLLSLLDHDIEHAMVSYDENVDSGHTSQAEDSNSVIKEIKSNVRKIFFHKRKEWEHENEYRLIKRYENIEEDEYFDFRDALKYIILSSKLQENDEEKYGNKLSELKRLSNIPILIYGNGFLDYSLYDINREETFWNASDGYDVLFLFENCQLDLESDFPNQYLNKTLCNTL